MILMITNFNEISKGLTQALNKRNVLNQMLTDREMKIPLAFSDLVHRQNTLLELATELLEIMRACERAIDELGVIAEQDDKELIMSVKLRKKPLEEN
ncbi:hypothetical protein LCGC14_0812270 [marine sediment metagenome]|uniref:PhoU domain-containing protein n=1 Tax=marine sediment metagenome TaxID=412755 RepID=A0A0F9PQV8_9ZZZZ